MQTTLTRASTAERFSALMDSVPPSQALREDAFVRFGQKIYRLPGQERREAFNAWQVEFVSVTPHKELGRKFRVLAAKSLREYILAPYNEVRAGGNIDQIIEQYNLSETKQMMLEDVSLDWGLREMLMWYSA